MPALPLKHKNNNSGVIVGTYFTDNTGQKRAKIFHATIPKEIYINFAKDVNMIPGEWKCTKMIVKPYWVSDAKVAAYMDHVALFVDKGFRIEPLDVCEPIIQELRELDKLKYLGYL